MNDTLVQSPVLVQVRGRTVAEFSVVLSRSVTLAKSLGSVQNSLYQTVIVGEPVGRVKVWLRLEVLLGDVLPTRAA